MRTGVVIGVLAALGGGGWLGYRQWFTSKPEDRFVFGKVDRGDVVRTVSAAGTIEPLVKVVVGSQVSGNIKKWYTDFNATVTADTVLAELDPDRFLTVLAQTKADLALARASEEEAAVRYRDAERELKRIQGLFATNSASENETLVAQAARDAAQAAWHGAQANVEAAEARLRAAEVDLSRTIIRSPIDGVVISRDVDVGQTVAASLQAPTLFTIANDLRQMQVNANVSEADIGLIAEGMPATFTVDAYPRRRFSGRISQIRFNPTIVDNVVTYVTLIQVSNEDLALRPGMTANVTFEVARAANIPRVPNAAFRFRPADEGGSSGPSRGPDRDRGPVVYQLVAGAAKAIPVEVGLSDGAFTELKGGPLKEGDRVITEHNFMATGRRPPDMTGSFQRSR